MNQTNVTATISPISFADRQSIESIEPEENTEIIRFKKLAAKFKRKAKLATDEAASLQKQVANLRIVNDRAQAQINTLKEDNQMLQLQLDAGHASHVESETAWTSMKAQNNQLTVANESIQTQVESQRRELEKFSKERQDMVVLIKKLHNAICQSESNYSKLLDENVELRKRKSQRLFDGESIDFNLVTLPYKDADFTQKLTKIARSSQCSSIQKVQAIVNETAKEIDSKNSELDKIETEYQNLKNEIDDREAKCKKSNELYTMIFSELKQVEISSHGFDNRLFGETNQTFLNFMAKHALDFDFIQRNSSVPYELFSEETRAQIFAKYDGLYQTMFSAVFIINSELKRQVMAARDALEKTESIHNILQLFGCKSPEDLPAKIDLFLKKIEKLQRVKHHLASALNESQKNMKKANAEHEELLSQIEDLQTANNKLKVKIQHLSNERSNARSETRTVSQMPPPQQQQQQLQQHQVDESQNEAIALLKSQVIAKDASIQKLTSTIDSLKDENMRSADTISSLNQKLDAIQQAYQQIKIQQMNEHEKAKRKFRSIQRSHEHELAETTEQIEEIKRAMAMMTQECHKKIEQLNMLAKRLSNSLTESEKRNRDLCNDNSRLKIAVQSLQMKVASDEDKMKQERQTTEAKAVAQILAAETKMHESHSSEKAQIVGQKQSLIGFVADELGTMYGINASELDDEGFKELIVHVKSDLRKQSYCSV